jgi:exopolysaccharide biosynthesis WecB/TagA/CpsF family protein
MRPATAAFPAGAPGPATSQQTAAVRLAAPPGWPVAVLGVVFDPATIDEAVARIGSMVTSGRPHYVVTVNVDFLVQAHPDVELRRILLEADLVLCDGTPVRWASRWMGNPLPECVAGSGLALALLRSAAARGHRIFLLGAAPGMASAAEERLRQEHPALHIVGTYSPPFSSLLEMDHEEITRRVRAAKPDILLVSFGCPKQEKWLAMHYRSLGVPVTIGLGATLDFLAGRVKRAPAWMRCSGTERLYRMVLEPRRLYRRYASDLWQFLPTLAAQWWRLRPSGDASACPPPNAGAPPGWRRVDAGDQLTRASLEVGMERWLELAGRHAHRLPDLSRTSRIDGTGVAFLIRWRQRLHAGRRKLVLLAPSRRVLRVPGKRRLLDHFVLAGAPAGALQGAVLPPSAFARMRPRARSPGAAKSSRQTVRTSGR